MIIKGRPYVRCNKCDYEIDSGSTTKAFSGLQCPQRDCTGILIMCDSTRLA